jgi:hypothetical protein
MSFGGRQTASAAPACDLAPALDAAAARRDATSSREKPGFLRPPLCAIEHLAFFEMGRLVAVSGAVAF